MPPLALQRALTSCPAVASRSIAPKHTPLSFKRHKSGPYGYTQAKALGLFLHRIAAGNLLTIKFPANSIRQIRRTSRCIIVSTSDPKLRPQNPIISRTQKVTPHLAFTHTPYRLPSPLCPSSSAPSPLPSTLPT